MIFPEVTNEEWSKRYPGLTPKSTNCKHCNGVIVANIPYISKDYAGFVAFKCPHCGGDHRTAVSIPISQKEKKAWADTFSQINQ